MESRLFDVGLTMFISRVPRFLQMCAPLGVDPLQASKKSFWSQLLGMGDFYHELAVKVAEV